MGCTNAASPQSCVRSLGSWWSVVESASRPHKAGGANEANNQQTAIYCLAEAFIRPHTTHKMTHNDWTHVCTTKRSCRKKTRTVLQHLHYPLKTNTGKRHPHQCVVCCKRAILPQRLQPCCRGGMNEQDRPLRHGRKHAITRALHTKSSNEALHDKGPILRTEPNESLSRVSIYRRQSVDQKKEQSSALIRSATVVTPESRGASRVSIDFNQWTKTKSIRLQP